MFVLGECFFISAKAGKKNDKDWYMLKFLDEDADSFFTAFVDRKFYDELLGVPKKTLVKLTLNLVPGEKFFTVEDVEVVD